MGGIRAKVNDNNVASGREETFIGQILGYIAKPILKFALTAIKWEMESADAFKAIPARFKEYALIRTPKCKLPEDGTLPIDDGVIKHYSSLHMALKEERQAFNRNLNEARRNIAQCALNRSTLLGTSSLLKANQDLLAAKTALKERKLYDPTSTEYNLHASPMSNLVNVSGKGQSFFVKFTKRCFDKPESPQQRVAPH